VRPENLHVTLKFIGEVPETRLADIRGALASVRSEQSVALDFRGLGFFPNENILAFLGGIVASANLQALAADIDGATEKLGIRGATAFFIAPDARALRTARLQKNFAPRSRKTRRASLVRCAPANFT